MTTSTDYQHEPCGLCGVDCSTHPDAGNSLAGCGDCGAYTCPDHRVEDAATRCNDCAARFYATPATWLGMERHTPPALDTFTFAQLARRVRVLARDGRRIPAALKAEIVKRGGSVERDGFVWAPDTTTGGAK